MTCFSFDCDGHLLFLLGEGGYGRNHRRERYQENKTFPRAHHCLLFLFLIIIHGPISPDEKRDWPAFPSGRLPADAAHGPDDQEPAQGQDPDQGEKIGRLLEDFEQLDLEEGQGGEDNSDQSLARNQA